MQLGFQSLDCFTRKDYLSPDPAKYSQPREMAKVLELVLGVAVLCDNKEELISHIMSLPEDTQHELKEVIEAILAKYAPSDAPPELPSLIEL